MNSVTGLAVQGSIMWYPFPANLPLCEGQYLAGHTTAILLYWSNGTWKTRPGDESDLTNRVRWWAEIPLPPNDAEACSQLLARLRCYNPPDRTIDEHRQMAQDIQDAADAIERLQSMVDAG